MIFAGYPDRMEHFLEQNPGLRSRIAFHVPFDDYTPEQLVDITRLLAGKKKLTVEPAAAEKLLAIYRDAAGIPDAGNGRLARNLLEKACMHQAGRLIQAGPEHVSPREVGLLLPEDFEAPVLRSGRSSGPSALYERGAVHKPAGLALPNERNGPPGLQPPSGHGISASVDLVEQSE